MEEINEKTNVVENIESEKIINIVKSVLYYTSYPLILFGLIDYILSILIGSWGMWIGIAFISIGLLLWKLFKKEVRK